MAKILYGMSGEGLGHSARAQVVVKHLEDQGHSLRLVSSDQSYDAIKPWHAIERIDGLRTFIKDNEVQVLTTVLKNLAKFNGLAKSVNLVMSIAETWQPDIILSDFEPVTGLVAKLKKIPLISSDNQHMLTRTKIEYPVEYLQEALAAKTVVRLVNVRAQAYIITTFFRLPINHKNTYLVPPVLRPEISQLKSSQGDYILVYLNTSKFAGLTEILKKLKHKFVIYGLDQDCQQGNLTFKPISQQGFLQDLAGCAGVIANAGFTLMTESLYLGKPFLALPMKGQFEQVLNSYYLQKLGYGRHQDDLDGPKITDFLNNLEHFRENLKNYRQQDNSLMFAKLDETIKKLCKQPNS